MLVEVCVNSLQSALNAQGVGADRIELCSELGVGGVTPSYGLMKLARQHLQIPIHVLIRPRGAHFTYSKPEFEVMLEDIKQCKTLGVDGIVSGALNPDATIDFEKTQQLVEASKPLHFTFHRAFDWVPDPEQSLKQLEDLGINTILTSGKHLTAENGLQNLKEWQSKTKITIMPGAGVNPQNVHLFKNEGFRAVHLSGTQFENEVSMNRKVPMHSKKHLEEHHVAVTNTEIIRQTVQAVK